MDLLCGTVPRQLSLYFLKPLGLFFRVAAEVGVKIILILHFFLFLHDLFVDLVEVGLEFFRVKTVLPDCIVKLPGIKLCDIKMSLLVLQNVICPILAPGSCF